MRKRHDTKHKFISCFDEQTGFYMRTGDPFMSSFPELLDVGIMGHCHGMCAQSGVQCYQSGSVHTQENMSLEDFKEILHQCHNDTYQIALGGRGDPDMHEDFEEILAACRVFNVIPNFTSSGFAFTEETAALCKKYCGAVAISWYRSPYTERAINLLLQAGVRTNIHYVLGKNTIDEAIQRLKTNNFPAGINAVIFLLHKPIGLGTKDNVLSPTDLDEFFHIVDTGHFPFKIGFDSCTIPGLVNNCRHIAPESLDTCEGARWSAYITPDMKMLPCSFDNNAMRWAVDLSNHTIQEAWDSELFEDFRSNFREACPSCSKREACMGGCPISPEIVLCKEVTA